MKKYLLGAVAAFAVAAPGMAAADSADIGVHFATTDVDTFDYDQWGLDGAYVHQFGGDWIVQMDGSHDSLDFGGADLGVSYGAVNVGVRNAGYAFYGFAGLGDLFAISTTSFGVGGQLYLGQATINGSAGVSDFDGLDMTNVHVDGVWFFTDNFGVTAEAGMTDIDFTDWTTLGVGAAWRPTGSNFTFNAGFRSMDFEGAEGDQWRFGITYNIGTSSERERSQSGASLNGARTLYDETSLLSLFP